jgi:SAM-dependent methyltransferase
MTERDYVLGTHDAELERLGLQHHVWRPHALDAWQRAGITVGQTVVVVGAGPGFATQDLAEIVGAGGRVVAVERSGRFLAALRARTTAMGLRNIDTIEADLLDAGLPAMAADAIWCRWVLCFVADPRTALRRMLAMLNEGGVAVFHEYADYRAWRLAPRGPSLERYVEAVMVSWRATGGEPDIALDLPAWLTAEGFKVDVRPIVYAVPSSSFVWQWPVSFIETGSERLVELGFLTAGEAAAVRREVADAARAPGTLMITPTVLEIIARRP